MTRPEYVAAGLMGFAESEILPALSGWQLWTSSAALELVRQRADTIVTALASDKTAHALGLVDAAGLIDVDALISAMKETARKHGKLTLDVPMLGRFSFAEADFEKLREHIAQAQGV